MRRAYLYGSTRAVLAVILTHCIFVIHTASSHSSCIIGVDSLRLQIINYESGNFCEDLCNIMSRFRTRLEEG